MTLHVGGSLKPGKYESAKTVFFGLGNEASPAVAYGY